MGVQVHKKRLFEETNQIKDDSIYRYMSRNKKNKRNQMQIKCICKKYIVLILVDHYWLLQQQYKHFDNLIFLSY